MGGYKKLNKQNAVLDAGNASEMHLSSAEERRDDDDLAFTLDFNVGTMNRRQDIQTRLVAASLNLRKKLTRADNGEYPYYRACSQSLSRFGRCNLFLKPLILLLYPGRGAEYCDKAICLSVCLCMGEKYCNKAVCLSVCLFVCLSFREHISGTTGPTRTKFCVQIP